jgi:hypothetical protein
MSVADGRHFSPDTINVMRVALDVAWNSLTQDEQAQSSKTFLATRILDAAALGVRSTDLLVKAALTGATSRPH